MIIAVEGPSAAGKTTWCRASGGQFVAEYASNRQEPDESDLVAQANFWAEVNAQRWTQALILEEAAGQAICDGDPLKLHYSWCLAAVGAAPISRFEHELTAVRQMFAQRRLGFADVVLLSNPGHQQLGLQRNSDPTRRRRDFNLHARLAEPLSEWYAAVNRLDGAGRVFHEFPADLDAAASVPPRSDRCDQQLIDRLLSNLPALTG